MATHKEYTYWVMPAEPLRSQLKSAIQNLYKEFSAVDFDPHVTVYCSASSDEEVHKLAAQIAKNFKPFEMRALRLEQSALLTKTFYVQFEESAALRRMCEMLHHGVKAPSDYQLNPHLSLLYQFIDETRRKELCQRNGIVPLGSYRFDRLRVYEMDLPVTDLQPIRTWRMVSEIPLG